DNLVSGSRPPGPQRGQSAPPRISANQTKESTIEGPVDCRVSVRPKDGEYFREYALRPRGITFEFPTPVNPSKHFSNFTKKDYDHCYRDSKVWLELDRLDT